MSDSSQPSPPLRIFRPWPLLTGFAVGLALLAWAGRGVTKRDWHDDFVRFHPMIAPDSMYEPTINEMGAIVRARCRPDQILVILGGNSILLGVGQPVVRVWTKRLQELLGDRYAVVNLAFRGSSPTDGGALVAESLRKEFPRQIYIANLAPLQGADAIGIESYRFVLFDAYYKGRLLPWAPRDEQLKKYLAAKNDHEQRFERRLSAQADVGLRYHDFWNWWSCTRFFTFATTMMPNWPRAYWPRNRFEDEESDYELTAFEERFTPQTIANDLKIARGYTAAFYSKNPDGTWQLVPSAYEEFLRLGQQAFPDPLKKRTLILISRNSPFYTARLEADLEERDELAIRDSIAGWEKLGYQSIDYGRDFEVNDFGDRTHLTSTGGAKLAATVAPKVRTMAIKLGYVSP